MARNGRLTPRSVAHHAARPHPAHSRDTSEGGATLSTDETTPAPPLGRREANKRATREALQQAADRLFAERGAQQTTVRDIADAVGVTERTFFRYFVSKEDLILRGAFSWMPALQEAIRTRPASEPPLLAVRGAVVALLPGISRLDAASPLALFADGAPAFRVGASAGRLVFRLETDLADALEQRIVAAAAQAGERAPRGAAGHDARFDAEVLARSCVAAFRTAMLRDSELRRAGAPDRPSLAQLLERAFDVIAHSGQLP